jgi:4-amino-4-deoxy-L-arabinose transferase-like glycosyltransferase
VAETLPQEPTEGMVTPAPAHVYGRGPLRPVTIAWLVALLGWTIVVSFYDLGGGARFEPTDCWVSQTAREMLEAQDWVIPRFSGETRFQKSPGAYWAVMLVSLARGGVVDEIATRIPNAIAAVLLVWTVFWLTRRIAGPRAAIFAGFAMASSGFILHWSHRGASDLGLTAFLTLSLASLWVASADEPPGPKRTLLWLLGYFAAGCAMLYKMPMPLPCIGVPALFYVLIQRRWRVFASWWHLVGLALFCLPWLPWAIGVLQSDPIAVDKWRVEFLDRFTGDLPNVEHQQQWFYYLFYLLPPFMFALPYAFSLPVAFGRAFRRDPQINRDGMRFLLIWFLSLFAFFTLATGKETRYFLPALPPLFVMLGYELSLFFDPRRAIPQARLKAGLLAIWLLVPAGFVAGAFGLKEWQAHEQMFAWNEVWRPYAVAAVLFCAGAMYSAWLFYRRRGNFSFGVLVATTWVAWMWIWSQFMPVMVSQNQSLDFAAQLRDQVPAEAREHIYQIGHQDSRIVWYSDVRFPRVVDQLELLRRQGGERSLAREVQIVGEEVLRKLDGEELALFVIGLRDYQQLVLGEGPKFAERLEMEMPATHVWIATRIGPPKRRYVLFGNQPPPWDEPELPAP